MGIAPQKKVAPMGPPTRSMYGNAPKLRSMSNTTGGLRSKMKKTGLRSRMQDYGA